MSDTITQQLGITTYPVILRDGFNNVVYEDDGITWIKYFYNKDNVFTGNEIGNNHLK